MRLQKGKTAIHWLAGAGMFGIIEFVQERMATYLPADQHPLEDPAGSGRALS